MRRRAEAFFGRHPAVALGFAEILLIFAVATDIARLRRAAELRGTMAGPAIAVGATAAVAFLGLGLWFSARFTALSKPVRKAIGWTMGVWGILAFASFIWFHPRHHFGSYTPTTSFATANVAFTASLLAIAAIGLPVLMWSRKRRPEVPIEHAAADSVEVWHVRDRRKRGGPPYFIASCECGWFGVAHDESEPGAETAAFKDAKSHGTNVRPELAYPMD